MEWSPQQRSIICAPKVSLKIEAGPGSGKTRTITERIIHFIEEEYYVSSQILALTFSVKANLELKRRLFTRIESLCASIEIKTFHSLAFKLLREHAPHYRNLKICDQPKIQARICEDAIAPFRHLPLFPKEFQTPESALWHAGFFKRKHILRLLDPKDVSWEKILTHAIQQHFHDHGYALFDDLCVDALRLLQEDRDIQKQYHQRWAALFVDEFQDLNPLQFEFLKALCGSETVLTVVGDTDQAIFGWRGGDANLLYDFALHFPNVQSKALSQNFRCPQNIVSVANHLIQHNTDRTIKNLYSEIPGGNVTIERFTTEEEELNACTARVKKWLDQKIPPNEMAVLCRNLDTVQALRAQLHTLGITVAGDNPLHSPEGHQIIALLYFVFRKQRLSQAINIGERRLRKSFYRHITQQEKDLFKALEHLTHDSSVPYPKLSSFLKATEKARKSTLPLMDNLTELFRDLSLPTEGQDNPVSTTLVALQRLIRELAKHCKSADVLLEELQVLETTREDFSPNVSVLTLHKSKGLEFQYVCILGNQNNIFPHIGLVGTDKNAIEEERRLLYVGLTRAKREVVLSNHRASPDSSFTFRDGFLHEIAHLCEIRNA